MVTANTDQGLEIAEIPVCAKCASAYCPGARGGSCRHMPEEGDACYRCGSPACLASGGPICRHTGLLRPFSPKEPESKDAQALQDLSGKVQAVEARLTAWSKRIAEVLEPKPAPAPARGRSGGK